ncbi:hypothetical protein C7C45_06085 [Micromonospora arborensis]|uniref:Uncharacterized protein n=1 Tax=Micromonospora arborensis TaxID=2116518 RepID=A0A318NPM9_9ACTN|nr:hypothetical protein C7C45_06085 [Micromonospora arborensis]
MLHDPYVVTVILRNTGRHAIASEHFDQGRPIRIDLGVSVEALLHPPDGAASSGVAVDGQAILFGPELIRHKQETLIQILTSDAPKPSKDAVIEHLVDTEVRVEEDGYAERERSRGALLGALTSIAGLVFAAYTLVRELIEVAF